MIERERILKWWGGRLTDQDLAQAAGMNFPNLKWLFRQPVIQGGIVGGGRGSRYSRVLQPAVRNAVAIAEAARVAGLTMQRASQIVAFVPGYSERVNSTIDWVPDPTDMIDYHGLDVPLNLFDIKDELRDIPLEEALDRSFVRECDPLGFWDPDMSAPVAEYLDERLFVYDGCIVSNDGPRDARKALLWLWRDKTSSKWSKEEVMASTKSATERRGEHPVGRLNGDGFILWTLLDPSKIDIRAEKPNEKLFEFIRENFKTRLEINATLPVRLMKRRFYGLKVDE